MKLAFSGEGRYPEFEDGYRLYLKRARTNDNIDLKTYKKVVRLYCRRLAERLCENGIVDLPSGLGSIAAVTMDRKPQFRGTKFIGYGKKDWETGQYDWSKKAFGIAFLARSRKKDNLRSYGFVANRRLFKKISEHKDSFYCNWKPLEFNDEMI